MEFSLENQSIFGTKRRPAGRLDPACARTGRLMLRAEKEAEEEEVQEDANSQEQVWRA